MSGAASTGVGLGSTLQSIKGMGSMDCGPISQTRIECLTRAYGPGPRLDLVGGKVIYLALALAPTRED